MTTMKNKKRTKKYNPVARAQSYAKHYSKQFAIAWCGPSGKAETFTTKNLRRKLLKPAEAMAITQVLHRWKVHAVAIMRDHTGEDYIQTVECVFPQELYSDQISDAVNEQINQLLKDCNSNHFVNTGWVATTGDVEITDYMITKMMMFMDAWDYLAKWEATDDSEPVLMEGG